MGKLIKFEQPIPTAKPSIQPSPPVDPDRIKRIREGLDRINALMFELKQMRPNK